MEIQSLKIDITKVKTVANYAKSVGLSTTRIYQLNKEGKIKIIKIDGNQYVDLTKTK